jgi:hypothetical protein
MLLAQVLGLEFILGTEEWWPLYMMIITIPSLPLVMVQGRMVESPVWLANRSPLEQAVGRKILAELREKPVDSQEIIDEFESMRTIADSGATSFTGANAQQDAVKGDGLFADPRSFPGMMILIVVHMSMQLSGINSVFNFATTFLVQSGMDKATVMLINVLMNIGNVMITLVSASLMDSLGRKSLLLTSAFMMTASVAGLTVALTTEGDPAPTWISPLATVSTVGFVSGFGIGMGCVPWLLAAELLPPEKMGQGASFACTLNWMTNFAVGLTFLTMTEFLGGWVFVPNAVVLVLMMLFVTLFMPETRGKTVDQVISEMLGDSDPLMGNSDNSAPGKPPMQIELHTRGKVSLQEGD